MQTNSLLLPCAQDLSEISHHFLFLFLKGTLSFLLGRFGGRASGEGSSEMVDSVLEFFNQGVSVMKLLSPLDQHHF